MCTLHEVILGTIVVKPTGTAVTNEQYTQCTYNVTMRRVHETLVAVEKHTSCIFL